METLFALSLVSLVMTILQIFYEKELLKQELLIVWKQRQTELALVFVWSSRVMANVLS